MGIDESIYLLEHQGFEINRDGGNFMVSFPRENAMIPSLTVGKKEKRYNLSKYGRCSVFCLRFIV